CDNCGCVRVAIGDRAARAFEERAGEVEEKARPAHDGRCEGRGVPAARLFHIGPVLAMRETGGTPDVLEHAGASLRVVHLGEDSRGACIRRSLRTRPRSWMESLLR